MTIFAVIGIKLDGPSGTMGNAISQTGLPNLSVTDNTWLVADSGTAKQLGDKIGLSDGLTGTGVITEVGSYWGRADPAVWSWIKQHWGTVVDG